MPDGLQLYALDGGKLEIMQEVLESANDMDDSDLGNCMVFLYASRYDDVKNLELDEMVEAGAELVRGITVEDKQAAEEIILADFDALQASAVKSPKAPARNMEEQSPSSTPPTSGPDLALVTAEETLQKSPPLKSSKLPSQRHTQTEKTLTHSNGQSATRPQLKTPEISLKDSSLQPG